MKYDSDRFHFSHDIVTASNRLSITLIVHLTLTIEGNELILEDDDVFTMGSSLISWTNSSGTLTVSSPVSTNGSVTIDTIELSRSAFYGLSIDESLIITGLSENSSALSISGAIESDGSYFRKYSWHFDTVTLSDTLTADSVSIGSAANTSLSISTPVIVIKIKYQ
ncbi:hypothetical protein ADUPG1_000001 [Aduncisulcus paluster]|uniref:Uncharacterized protein n=1 Tax=Aduncisulcus paluster TaxID=2918883 RepID=A0ABQ5K7M2_9EUKA|nr:hypothetical protein ADUPG1_000001 [Aduncisulcus paluster]